MKLFKDYLTESTKTYSFKLKIAGELPDSVQDELQAALSKFSIVKLSSGKRSPIVPESLDFPDLKNVRITVWDIEIRYPTTQQVLEEVASRAINLPLHCVKVLNLNEPLQQYQEECKCDSTTDLLSTPELEAAEGGQELVGQARVSTLWKEIVNAARKTGEQYTGTNDNILAASAPKEKADTSMEVGSEKSVIGSSSKKEK